MGLEPFRFIGAQPLVNPPLLEVNALEGEGLRFSLRHTFVSDSGVPGYLFDIFESDGSRVGDATLKITSDFASVARTGHIGCEVRPELRGLGHTVRLGRVLMAFAKKHGLTEILLTCGADHSSQIASFRELGGTALDELPALEAGGKATARFRVPLE